jgi:hypothetical protein
MRPCREWLARELNRQLDEQGVRGPGRNTANIKAATVLDGLAKAARQEAPYA